MTSSPTNQGVGASKSFGNPGHGYTLECDYDANPSFLYQALEAKQWDYAIKFFSKPDGALQAATWVTRKEKNGKLRWRLLPIHAAIIFGAPVKVIELLLQEYPPGAQQKDDQGMLPLHLAFRNDSSWDVLEELLTAFPQGINVKDRKGRLPIGCASGTTSKRASVLELYSQIAISSERQNAVTESRTALDARIAALQETHINTLTNLKEEWEFQHEALEKEVRDSKRAEEITAVRLKEAQALLAQKSNSEAELTHKLGMVTMALQSVNKARAEEAKAVAERTASEKEKETDTTTKDPSQLQEANEELLYLVQTLLDQQTELKAQLDKQAYSFKDETKRKAAILKELAEVHRAEEEAASTDRDIWRSRLGESNEQVSWKLKSVMAMMDGAAAPKASRGGKGP
ncbi:hypothetical protein MHU86_5470 [Fragilaria crotonensis]|nr:hypothetical protein MHU86_5470 [Fragilaria crotonensis]